MRDKTCNECIDFVAHRNFCLFHKQYTMARARGCYFFKHITKGDIFRQMSNEEIVEVCEDNCKICSMNGATDCGGKCGKGVLEWFNAEAEPAEIEKMRDAQRKKEENYD